MSKKKVNIIISVQDPGGKVGENEEIFKDEVEMELKKEEDMEDSRDIYTRESLEKVSKLKDKEFKKYKNKKKKRPPGEGLSGYG